jgi:release factor glutamine methyltransferase
VSAPALPATLRDLLADATTRLTRAGCDSPRLDAELLLAHVLGSDRAGLVTGTTAPPAVVAAAEYEGLLRRREAREPVAYLTGRRGFRDIELDVDRRVLIPRPETELLVEVALGLPQGAYVADVGTGSGAVAVALAAERPDLRIVALERDPGAVEVARRNAAAIAPQVEVVESDLLAAAPTGLDAILANLPYVPDGELAGLMPEVSRYEPRGALAGGFDGLDVVRALLEQADARFVALEIGAGQAQATSELLAQGGWSPVAHRDLAGIERVVVGER